MAEFADRMNKMVVKVVSPQGAVQARLEPGQGFTFEVSPRAMEVLAANQLAEEATAALSGVLEGLRKGIGMARNGEPPPKQLPQRRRTDPPLGPRDEFRYAMAEVDVTGSAAGGLVQVNWHSEWDATVRIKAAVSNRMDAVELSEALRSAMADAYRARANAVAPLIRQTFKTRLEKGSKNGD